MDITSAADWLWSGFSHLDNAVLEGLHCFAVQTDGFYTPFFTVISLLAKKGVGMLVIGIVLLCFQKTRKAGICVCAAVCCGAVITDVVLKDIIARPRPFVVAASVYNEWWRFVGAPHNTGFSFPSGHTTATMAAMTALFLQGNKRYSWAGFGLVALMGISRCYLMAHYPSDILGGLIVGTVSAVVAYCGTWLFYRFLNKHATLCFCKFVLNFDFTDVFHSRRRHCGN